MHKRKRLLMMLGCLVLCTGCFNSERDNLQDPYNTPILRILEATYEQDRGAVMLRWEYLGRETVQQFRVFRKVGTESGFRVVAGIEREDASGGESGTAFFRDTELVAGEVIQYSVSADGVGGGLAGSDPVPVRVAGAKMSHLGLDYAAGAVRVFWDANAEGAAAYEVVRSSEENPGEVVYRTEDVRETSWIDSGLRGDLTYTYVIRTVMANGVRMDSRPDHARLYELLGDVVLEDLTQAGGRICLFDIAEYGVLPHGVFVWRQGEEGVEAVRLLVNTRIHTQQGKAIIESGPVDIGTLAPSSLSAIGPSPQQGQMGAIKMHLTGIDVAAGQAVLNAYGNAPSPIFTTSWPVGGASARTAACWNDDGLLLVAAGGRLWAFSGLQEAGSVVIEGEPGDLLYMQQVSSTQSACVWAALPDEGRMLRGELGLAGGRLASVTWHEVALPAGARPVALMAYTYDQVFALDAGNRQMLVFDALGRQLLHWPVPLQDAEHGDMATNSYWWDLIHVLDGNGRLLSYGP